MRWSLPTFGITMDLMETTVVNHIASKPGVCGGKPCVEGTRIRVQDVYVWHLLQGQSVEQIVSNFPQLSMADVHAALAYYWDNREQIHDEMRAAEEHIEEMKEHYPSQLREKLAEMGIDPNQMLPL